MQKTKTKKKLMLLAGLGLALAAVLINAAPATKQMDAATKRAIADPGDNQAELLVSPSVWVLDTKAIQEITIHAAYPYSLVDNISLTVINADVNKIETEILTTFADDRGDLVIKFVPTIEPEDIGKTFAVTIAINGSLYPFTSSILVKERVEPSAPTDPEIIVLSGDKVRGEEGLGSVEQNCTLWEGACPYGDYDPEL